MYAFQWRKTMIESVITEAVERIRTLYNLQFSDQLVEFVIEDLQKQGYQTEAAHFQDCPRRYIEL